MGSRIAATVIVILGVAALAWVVLGPDSAESVSESVASTADDGAAEASDSSRADDDATSAGATNAGAANAGAAGAAGDGDGAAQTEPTETGAQDTPVDEPAEPTATPEPAVPAPENFGQRMDLIELDGWLNTDATSIDDFNGQVLLVEMWTFGCHNCKARIPHNQSYYDEFADENFEIIGVHAPEFSYEAEVPNIIEAAERLGVTWPIALDTTKKNFRAWQPGRTNFWPRTYVIDQNGDIRFDHIGEGKYDEVRETIRYLIENPPPPPAAQ